MPACNRGLYSYTGPKKLGIGFIYQIGAGIILVSETGTGDVVRKISPTLVAPLLGIPTSGDLRNCIGLPLDTGVTGILPIAKVPFVDLVAYSLCGGL